MERKKAKGKKMKLNINSYFESIASIVWQEWPIGTVVLFPQGAIGLVCVEEYPHYNPRLLLLGYRTMDGIYRDSSCFQVTFNFDDKKAKNVLGHIDEINVVLQD